jgi:hypothetical protein
MGPMRVKSTDRVRETRERNEKLGLTRIEMTVPKSLARDMKALGAVLSRDPRRPVFLTPGQTELLAQGLAYLNHVGWGTAAQLGPIYEKLLPLMPKSTQTTGAVAKVETALIESAVAKKKKDG